MYEDYGEPGTNGANIRYGFNGMERDDEMKGTGNSYDFEARIYDSRLGRWLSSDPQFTNNSHLSPFGFAENNPIFFVDPDGENAVATVDEKSGTITVKAEIHIQGAGANKAKAARMQQQINKYWGQKNFKYTDKATGKVYNVKFDISVKSCEEVGNEQPDWDTHNLVTLVDSKKADPKDKMSNGLYRSNVVNSSSGSWATEAGAVTYAHEVGHLLGINDMYVEWQFDRSYTGGNLTYEQYDIVYTDNYIGVAEDDIMGEASGDSKGKAKVSQENIDAIAAFAIKNKDKKTGKAILDKKSDLRKPTMEQMPPYQGGHKKVHESKDNKKTTPKAKKEKKMNKVTKQKSKTEPKRKKK